MPIMPTMPHDVSDLHLAPLLLALDARLDDLGRYDREQLSHHVAVVSDQPDWTRELRAGALLVAVQHLIDCHGWTLSWHPRGVQVSHGDRHLVLGVPATFAEYVSGPAAG